MCKLLKVCKNVQNFTLRRNYTMATAFKESYYWEHGEKSPNCGIFGHSFIRRLCRRWNNRSLPVRMPFRGEAHGTGGLTASKLLTLLRHRNLSKFDVIFIQIGENDMLTLSNHQLMYALLEIYAEIKRQGVAQVIFGCLFPRHDRRYNKLAKRLNKILKKLHPGKIWYHGDQLISNASIDPRDKTHLLPTKEISFAYSIADALEFMAKKQSF